jgi:hypothetical protein
MGASQGQRNRRFGATIFMTAFPPRNEKHPGSPQREPNGLP